PSMFLEEVPQEDVDTLDLSSGTAQRSGAADSWHGRTSGASQGWYDTGFKPAVSQERERPETVSVADPAGYEVDVLVHHDVYGVGRITEVSGQGALRKL